MKKIKIFIIACSLLTFCLAVYLIFIKAPSDIGSPVYNDLGKASASTVSPDTVNVGNTDINSDDYTYIPPGAEYDNNNENKEDDQMTDIWFPAKELDLDPNSITVFVNKEYCLPEDFVPDNLVVPNILFDISGYSERKLLRKEAARAIEELFAAALKEGYTLYGISGYRSFERQKEIFLNNLIKKGKKHTLKYSAAPGTSEHQTGLAMDVSTKSLRFKLVTAFANCPEGKWLAEHAHEYGFIIRYPKDREDITGYAYEPWHIRYVGKELAAYLYANNLTLDEYYNYTPSPDFDYEKKYANLLNYKPPVTPTPTPDLEDEPDEDMLPEDMPGDLTEEDPEDLSVDLPDDLPDDMDDEDDYLDNKIDLSSETNDPDMDFEERTDLEESENITDNPNNDEGLLNYVNPAPTPTAAPTDITEAESSPNME